MEHHSPIDIPNLLAMIEAETHTPAPKVTIYFSVPHSSNFAILGRAELKADIQSVAARMKAMHTPDEPREAILKKLHTLLQSNDLWARRSESYVIFASASLIRFYALPIPVHDNVWVNSDYQITPLVPLLALPEHFYVLDVSLRFPRLVRVHAQFSVPVELRKIWEIEVEQSEEEPIHGRSFHTSAHSIGNGMHGGMIPHGSADSDHSAVRTRERFMRVLAREVDALLHDADEPLILTGASEVIEQFRTHLKYHNVLVRSVRIPISNGDPIVAETSTWLTCANAVSDREKGGTEIADEIGAMHAAGRVCENLDEILSLSRAGSVMTLLVEDPALARRIFDPSELDRLNAALVMTLRHHGSAIQFNPLHSPAGVLALVRPGTTFSY